MIHKFDVQGEVLHSLQWNQWSSIIGRGINYWVWSFWVI
jgi:hypothetical protein